MHICPYCASSCRCEDDDTREIPYTDTQDCIHFITGHCPPDEPEAESKNEGRT